MIALPQPTKVFDSFWQFAAERHRVWQSRRSGTPPPWTSDSILSGHKFCNTFRVLDRVSQYCLTNVIKAGPQHPQELIFRISLFKYFNRIATWQLLERSLGPLEWRTFEYQKYSRVLDTAYHKGEHLFGSAYRANQRYRTDLDGAHLRYLALLVHVMKGHTLSELLAARSYEECFWIMRGLPLHGDFTAMQHLVDLNYSLLLNFDENDYVRCGPGCVAGINLCFGLKFKPSKANDMKMAGDVVRLCCDQQEQHFQNLGLEPISLFGRRLKLIDCQSLFCEISKFSKLKFPELHSEGGTVKPYDPTQAPPLPPLVFPAKWRRFP
jgi:hypothetical protein